MICCDLGFMWELIWFRFCRLCDEWLCLIVVVVLVILSFISFLLLGCVGLVGCWSFEVDDWIM